MSIGTTMLMLAVLCPTANRGELLLETPALASPSVQHVDVSGSSGGGVPFRFTVTREGPDVVEVSGYLRETQLDRVRVRSQAVPLLDLATAVAGIGDGVLEVTVKYGESRDCFVNDDARNRLRFIFTADGPPEVYDFSYENCGAVSETVPLE